MRFRSQVAAMTLALLGVTAWASQVQAADEGAKTFDMSLDLDTWTPGIDGTVGARNREATVHAGFLDIVENTDTHLAFSGRFEASMGPWRGYVDGTYIKLAKDNVSIGPSSVDFKAELAIVDFGIFYRLGQWAVGPANAGGEVPTLAVDVGPGSRYMHAGMELDTSGAREAKRNQDWIDPVGAVQLTLDLDRHWQLMTRGDVGGGVNADLTWSAAGLVSYRFTLLEKWNASVNLGYKAVSEDYSNDGFKWDAILHGPWFSFAIEF